LAVTLLVCLSFTPALLSGLGRIAFWPQLPVRPAAGRSAAVSAPRPAGRVRRYWGALAASVVAWPARAMLLTLLALGVPAAYGLLKLGQVTYDLTEELSESAPSRRGSRLIAQFFPTQAGSPLTLLLTRKQPFPSEEELSEACSQLSTKLYTQGVGAVRSLTDPLGDYPPGKRMGLFDKDAWRRRVLRAHRITQEHYVSSVAQLAQRVARFDVVLQDNPFSLDAGATLARLRRLLQAEVSDPASDWYGATVATSGTTVGIADLRRITQADQQRIQILVTLGVWLVLVLLLRQWWLSTYLIFTVLLSYFATLGITFATFAALYGADYSGLDWKVPIFLFVILVAVGQDYNVYLVTRIFEEQRRFGVREGVRRALEITGGIITSCGFVMAGTFIAMTSPAVLLWLSSMLPDGWIDDQAPVLRGITELGFALAFGVLLDTLVVRSILVPAFVVLRAGKQAGDRPTPAGTTPTVSASMGTAPASTAVIAEPE
ncbi:MAG: MMPL family transporter, partial [Planctomycetales bacterium]|nr:MMPL family transporter [Planctomycetales bacterium]